MPGIVSAVGGGIRGLFGGGDGFGKFATATLGVVGKFIKDKDAANRQLTEIELAELSATLEVTMSEHGLEKKALELEAEAIKGIAAQNLADAKSDDKWQRRWRPVCNVTLIALLVWVIGVIPTLQWVQTVWWPETPLMPESKYTMHLIIGDFSLLGVNMSGRTLEKIKKVSRL